MDRSSRSRRRPPASTRIKLRGVVDRPRDDRRSAACARRTRASVTSEWCSTSAPVRVPRAAARTRIGVTRRSTRSEAAAHEARPAPSPRCRTARRGTVKPVRTWLDRATPTERAVPVERADEAPLDEAEAPRALRPRRPRAAGDFRSRWTPISGASSTKNASASSSVGSSGATSSRSLGERHRPDGARGGAVAHLVEIVRVRDQQLAVAQGEHVELDEIDARLECGAKRRERVLRCERRRSAMPDPKRSAVASLERDHGAGRVGR